MKKRFKISEIPLISAPVTSSNLRNLRNNPAEDLGCCTPFQLFEYSFISHQGTVCIIGNPARGIGILKAMIHRSRKPFLFLGTAADRNSALAYSLSPDWTKDSAAENIPGGNGAIYFAKPYDAYLELCECIADWSQSHFIVLHLGNGLRSGISLLNILSSTDQCVIVCDSISLSLRSNESYTISSAEFLKQMRYLIVFSAGESTKELIEEILPTYQYEKLSDSTGINIYKGSSGLFYPRFGHFGYGFNQTQTRTKDFKKCVFEMDDLQYIFSEGYCLLYNAQLNRVFIALVC